MINIIAAMSKNRVIGDSNTLIWHLPEDLKRFRNLTIENTIVMGRKTYESIGRPLPNRRSIIITRDTDYKVEGCDVVNSLEEALLLSNSLVIVFEIPIIIIIILVQQTPNVFCHIFGAIESFFLALCQYGIECVEFLYMFHTLYIK